MCQRSDVSFAIIIAPGAEKVSKLIGPHSFWSLHRGVTIPIGSSWRDCSGKVLGLEFIPSIVLVLDGDEVVDWYFHEPAWYPWLLFRSLACFYASISTFDIASCRPNCNILGHLKLLPFTHLPSPTISRTVVGCRCPWFQVDSWLIGVSLQVLWCIYINWVLGATSSYLSRHSFSLWWVIGGVDARNLETRNGRYGADNYIIIGFLPSCQWMITHVALFIINVDPLFSTFPSARSDTDAHSDAVDM
jgi:hypothetical protein